MDVLLSLMFTTVYRTGSMLMDARQVIGLIAAFLAAMLAAQLGWHGTDRIIARRERSED